MFKNKNVLVTGGAGLLGREVIRQLLDSGANVRTTTHQKILQTQDGVEVLNGDLTEWNFCMKVTKNMDYVFHLAAILAGITRNEKCQSEVFTKNLLMNTKVMEAARLNNVERILFASSGAVYPDRYAICKEEYAWKGSPESSNPYYGYAKLMGENQARAYYTEHGIGTAIVRIASPYGPWDNFDPSSSFALQSFIRRGVKREDPFVIWGSGQGMRDYIDVRDVARGSLLALEKYAVGDPINLGTGEGVSMESAVRLIIKIVGYSPEMVFDMSKVDGRPMRTLDITKARDKLGFEPKFSLREGLARTINWCNQHPEALGM